MSNPSLLFQLAVSMIKHHAAQAVGDQTLALAGVEKWLEKPIITGRITDAIQQAEKCFSQSNADKRLREGISQLSLDDEPALRNAIVQLPTASDESALRSAIADSLKRDFSSFPPVTIDRAVDEYILCLRGALLTLKEFAPTVVGRAMLRIESILTRDVEILLEALRQVDTRAAATERYAQVKAQLASIRTELDTLLKIVQARDYKVSVGASQDPHGATILVSMGNSSVVLSHKLLTELHRLLGEIITDRTDSTSFPGPQVSGAPERDPGLDGPPVDLPLAPDDAVVVVTLLLARESLAAPHIAEFADLTSDSVALALSRLGPHLDEKAGRDKRPRYLIPSSAKSQFSPLLRHDPDMCIKVHERIVAHYLRRCDGDFGKLGDIPGEYSVTHLPYHLAEAHHLDELHSLVGQPGQHHHAWSKVRYDVEGTLQGFLKDLSVALSAAKHQGPRSIGWQIRHMLIRASLDTIASAIPPGLLARAVSLGLMEPTKALDLAQRSAAHDAHLWALAGVLSQGISRLPIDLRKQAVSGLLSPDAVHVADYPWDRPYIPLLGSLFRALTDYGLNEEAISLIGAFGRLDAWSLALIDQRPREVSDPSIRASITARFVESAGTYVGAHDAGALARWARALPREERGPVLRRATADFLAQIARVDERQLSSDLASDLVWALEKSRNYLSIDHVRQLGPFLTHLDSNGRRKVIDAALAAARGHDLFGWGMAQLSCLLPIVDSDQKKELEAETLEYCLNWRPGTPDGLEFALPVYVRGLSSKGRRSVINALRKFPGATRTWLLSLCVPHLHGAAQTQLISDIFDRIFSRNSEGLRKPLEYQKEWMEGLALDAIAPYLQPSQVVEALGLQEIGDGGQLALLKASHISRISNELENRLAAAFSREHHVESRTSLWYSLRAFARDQSALHGGDPVQWDWKERGPEDTLEPNVDALFARHLELLEKKFKDRDLSKNPDELSFEEQIQLLVVRASGADGDLRNSLIRQAMRLASDFTHPIHAARYQALIVPLADVLLRQTLAEEVLRSISTYRHGDAVVLNSAPFLVYCEPIRRPAWITPALRRAFDQASGHFWVSDNTLDVVLLAVADFWADFTEEELYDMWLWILERIERLPRPDLALSIASLAPLVMKLGGPSAWENLQNSVEDIGRWWP